MKKIYLIKHFIIFLILTSGTTYSQIISVDTSSNWQQWISSIFGGNCVEISNVEFNVEPGAAARFTQGGVIGLNSGLVLSTGIVNPAISASGDFFLSHDFQNNSSDTLLEQYGIQELGFTGFPQSFDASRFSFDFVAPTDQEVTLRFVFASEEYPEFAPPTTNFFNDIFAFL